MQEELELIAQDLIKIVDSNSKDYIISDITKNTEGWETDIYFFALISNKKQYEFALRIYLGNEKDSKLSAEKEFNLLKILYATNYSVPKVFLINIACKIIPNPFIIMEKINGRPLYSLLSSNKDQFESLLQNFFITFHTLHNLPIDQFKPIFSVNNMAENYSFTKLLYYILESRINTMENDKIKMELNQLISWSKNYHLVADSGTISLIHLDYHPGNVLVTDNTHELKVIDWNACAIGDYRFDIAWSQILSLPDISYFNLIESEYEKVSNMKIIELDYFLVLMGLRRLTDAILSIEGDSGSLSMKSETSHKIKQLSSHYIAIIRKLEEATKIKLPFLTKYFNYTA